MQQNKNKHKSHLYIFPITEVNNTSKGIKFSFIPVTYPKSGYQYSHYQEFISSTTAKLIPACNGEIWRKIVKFRKQI